MRPLSIFLLVCSVYFFHAGPVFAQDVKREREEGVKKSILPAPAVRFTELLPKNVRKLKYYRETDGETVSYEVKFSFKGKIYSVEFGADGTFQDAELTIGPNDVPSDVKMRVDSALSARYNRYKIRKVQKQYSCAERSKSCMEETVRLIKENDATDLHVRYEYEVDGAEGGKLVSHELLFGFDGAFLSERVILRRQTDNIFY